jgi:hypothetical protein
MQPTQVDLTTTRFFLTHSGYVALECDAFDGAQQLILFGPDGVLPPRRVLDLVDDMLKMLTAAPDDEDAAGLKVIVDDLKASLARVETVLARLETPKA